jgi:FkbM family methyltransferase
MPLTREEHIIYTRKELNNYPYYIEVIKILKDNKIKSYLDIGANVGEFCNVLFEKIETLEYAYLIEPESLNFEFLKSNVRNKNINFLNFAIGYNFINPILIPHPSKNIGGFMLNEKNNNDSYHSIQIRTLEELNLPIVDFVKIDIEGGEFNLIENSIYLQQIKWIEIEFHMNEVDLQKNASIIYVNDKFPNHTIKFLEPNLLGRILLERNG